VGGLLRALSPVSLVPVRLQEAGSAEQLPPCGASAGKVEVPGCLWRPCRCTSRMQNDRTSGLLTGPPCDAPAGKVEVPGDVAEELLQAADQYMLEGLKRLCEVAIARTLSVDSLPAAQEVRLPLHTSRYCNVLRQAGIHCYGPAACSDNMLLTHSRAECSSSAVLLLPDV
jgi:hypothetical protein